MGGSSFFLCNSPGNSFINIEKRSMRKIMLVRFYQGILYLFLFCSCGLLMVSCGKKEEKTKGDVEYYVCDETELPEELKVLIEERKEKEFRLRYENAMYSYLVAGYGKQEQDSYVVAVEDFYETEDGLILDTILLSEINSEKGKAGEAEICPYIVVRCTLLDKEIFFQ